MRGGVCHAGRKNDGQCRAKSVWCRIGSRGDGDRPPRSGQRKENALKIYVGNMPYGASSEDLAALFGQYGHVAEANVIMDRETGRSKGFGFVDMPNQSEANEAVDALNSSQMQGRTLRVSEARPRNDRGPRRPGGGGGGGRDRGGWR